MSRVPFESEDVPLGFPRVSGDEPLTGVVFEGHARFSPRERG